MTTKLIFTCAIDDIYLFNLLSSTDFMISSQAYDKSIVLVFFLNINYYYYTANICKLQIAQCEYKLHHRFLGLSHTGTCSSSGGTVSIPDHYDCRNPEPCDEEETTGEVCGSDGVTYSRRENLNLERIRFAVEDDT